MKMIRLVGTLVLANVFFGCAGDGETHISSFQIEKSSVLKQVEEINRFAQCVLGPFTTEDLHSSNLPEGCLDSDLSFFESKDPPQVLVNFWAKSDASVGFIDGVADLPPLQDFAEIRLNPRDVRECFPQAGFLQSRAGLLKLKKQAFEAALFLSKLYELRRGNSDSKFLPKTIDICSTEVLQRSMAWSHFPEQRLTIGISQDEVEVSSRQLLDMWQEGIHLSNKTKWGAIKHAFTLGRSKISSGSRFSRYWSFINPVGAFRLAFNGVFFSEKADLALELEEAAENPSKESLNRILNKYANATESKQAALLSESKIPSLISLWQQILSDGDLLGQVEGSFDSALGQCSDMIVEEENLLIAPIVVENTHLIKVCTEFARGEDLGRVERHSLDTKFTKKNRIFGLVVVSTDDIIDVNSDPARLIESFFSGLKPLGSLSLSRALSEILELSGRND